MVWSQSTLGISAASRVVCFSGSVYSMCMQGWVVEDEGEDYLATRWRRCWFSREGFGAVKLILYTVFNYMHIRFTLCIELLEDVIMLLWKCKWFSGTRSRERKDVIIFLHVQWNYYYHFHLLCNYNLLSNPHITANPSGPLLMAVCLAKGES